MRKLLLGLALCLLVSSPAFGAENPWAGTWKLDMSKSTFANSFTYTQTPDGMMHYVDGPEVTNFRIDGKPYTSRGIHTSTWTATGPRTWDTIHKAGDVVESTTHRQLSEDNQTFTMTTDGTAADGSTLHYVDVYTRVSGTTGLLGSWRSTSSTSTYSSDERITIFPSPPGTYHQQSTRDKSTIEGKTDGSEFPLKGPRISPGVTMAMKVVSPHSFTYTMKLDGNVQYEGVQTMAEDEKSFTNTSWIKGSEGTKFTYFYVRE